MDVRAAQAGLRDSADKRALAEHLLAETQAAAQPITELLTAQLGTVGRDDQFMTED